NTTRNGARTHLGSGTGKEPLGWLVDWLGTRVAGPRGGMIGLRKAVGNDPVVSGESAGRPSNPGRPILLTEVPRGGLVALLGDDAGRAEHSLRNACCKQRAGRGRPHCGPIAARAQRGLSPPGAVTSAPRGGSGAVAVLGLVVLAAMRAQRDAVIACGPYL